MTDIEVEFLKGIKDDIGEVGKKLDKHIEKCATVNTQVDRHTMYFQLLSVGITGAWAALIAWWKPHT